MIRHARGRDLVTLIRIENRSFHTDRLSRRALRHLLSQANAVILVDEDAEHGVRGYAVVLFRRGSLAARLYSIAVDSAFRHRGVGAALLDQAERTALARGAATLRLEVRTEDEFALDFYRSRDYLPFGRRRDYYADGADATRMEKALTPDKAAHAHARKRDG